MCNVSLTFANVFQKHPLLISYQFSQTNLKRKIYLNIIKFYKISVAKICLESNCFKKIDYFKID